MEFFRSLGSELDARWSESIDPASEFPSLAGEALRTMDPSSNVDVGELTAWLLDAPALPRQTRVAIEHPFTLFRTERFSINAYYWVDGTTDVHAHAFSGAFQVLCGASIHTRFDYVERARVTAKQSIGDLRVRSVEELRRGDVREISAGTAFIHSLFHLDRPSVTIVVATPDDPRHSPALSFVRPGLGLEVTGGDERRERRLKALAMVGAAWPSEYAAAARRFVSGPDADDACFGLLSVFQTLDGEAFDDVLHAAQRAHPALGDLWALAFEEHRRQANITQRRALVHDPEHRYFLAVLLNGMDRGSILELVRSRFPDRDPLEAVARWVEELAAIPVEGDAGPTALGVPLDEAALIVFRSLLEGGTNEAVFAALAKEFDAADVDAQRGDIVDMVDAFRSSLLFRTLLAPSTAS
jgi:hypothetical protein